MTTYGHSAYKYELRPIATKDFKFVKFLYLEYDDIYAMYLSVNVSLNQMIANMESYYESIGELDNTIFIIVFDHHQYALSSINHSHWAYSTNYTDMRFDDFAFEIYNISLIIYDSAISIENRNCYLSNIDILPLMADFFQLEYDYAYRTSPFSKIIETELSG